MEPFSIGIRSNEGVQTTIFSRPSRLTPRLRSPDDKRFKNVVERHRGRLNRVPCGREFVPKPRRSVHDDFKLLAVSPRIDQPLRRQSLVDAKGRVDVDGQLLSQLAHGRLLLAGNQHPRRTTLDMHKHQPPPKVDTELKQ